MKIVNNMSSFFKMNSLSIFFLFLAPVFVWSIISPKSLLTWIFESLPLFIGLIILVKSYKTFPLSSFSYGVIFIGATMILVGAHYTYSEVPIFHWIEDDLGFQRNNYDKLGHFFQGFITAILSREVLIKKRVIDSMKWLDFFAITFSIALSALWEILEWFVFDISVYFSLKKSASEFLGMQGYFWDAQSDILFATIGAIIAIVFFGKYHNKFINN